MGKVKIPYYVVKGGTKPGTRRMGYWVPCLARPNKQTGVFEPTLMAKLGFAHVACGEDGPMAWATAQSWNARWEAARKAHRAGEKVVAPGKIERVYPPNSLGECFARLRAIKAVWGEKKPRTQEDWWRGWALIDPVFGDTDPETITLELVGLWYAGDGTVEGLVQREGVRESHRAMKIFRALWAVGTSITRADGKPYCPAKDPSLGIRRKTPVARNAIYLEGEAVRLVKRAWRMGFRGLACIYAIAWDTMFSPVDARSVTPAQWRDMLAGPAIVTDRTKTGRTSIGTISRRTARVVAAYLDGLKADGVEILDTAPMFRTPGAGPGPKGGRRWSPRPYGKDLLGKHHRLVRDEGDTRTVMDFRRSGAVEALAGEVHEGALATKMANSIDKARELQKTYLPGQAAVVRIADAARVRGRGRLRGET